MKFSTESNHNKLSPRREFHENRFSVSHTSFKEENVISMLADIRYRAPRNAATNHSHSLPRAVHAVFARIFYTFVRYA
jgi:hypothetical protein